MRFHRSTSALAFLLLAGLAAGLAPSSSTTGSVASQTGPARPGPEHAWLGEEAGEWKITAEIRRPGSDEPLRVEGRSTMEMLWGRYLREEFEVGEGPTAMQGIGIQAYDSEAGEFRAVYCLNTGTSLSLSTGQRSDDGSVLTFVNEGSTSKPGDEPRSGRTVITREGENRRVREYFTTQGEGPERKTFEMAYTRME